MDSLSSDYQIAFLSVLYSIQIRAELMAKDIFQGDTFDTANREKFRPAYHHTPAYGWMNDPNGMFYKDGVYHLYYQWNPYGSMWENMTWGHSTSRDLIHWETQPTAIEPDALGAIFSGSCVVDKKNDQVVAFYTSARKSSSVLTNTGLPLYFSNVIPLSFDIAIDCTWDFPAEV